MARCPCVGRPIFNDDRYKNTTQTANHWLAVLGLKIFRYLRLMRVPAAKQLSLV
jgi:hypothetical protein